MNINRITYLTDLEGGYGDWKNYVRWAVASLLNGWKSPEVQNWVVC